MAETTSGYKELREVESLVSGLIERLGSWRRQASFSLESLMSGIIEKDGIAMSDLIEGARKLESLCRAELRELESLCWACRV